MKSGGGQERQLVQVSQHAFRYEVAVMMTEGELKGYEDDEIE